MRVVVATQDRVLSLDPRDGRVITAQGTGGRRPTCLAADPQGSGQIWCGTDREGVLLSEDRGLSWSPIGLEGKEITALTASPTEKHVLWSGTEPSALWRSEDSGFSWSRPSELTNLPSAGDWSFPPRPETHHVRWIACHPSAPGRLWVAIEAGALITTNDGGRTWRDRVPDGPFDTHELAIHPDWPDRLKVAAGDGYFESEDGGASWSAPMAGLDIHYLRSVAIDPDDPQTVVISGASGPRSAYVAGRSDGRIYRRTGIEAWRRCTRGWPDPPGTIAPLLLPGLAAGMLWAADERGIHLSEDAGANWSLAAPFPEPPHHLRGLVIAR